MQEALAMVRRELGPGASVLHTRQVRASGLWRWLHLASEIEVMASANVSVPSRMVRRDRSVESLVAAGAQAVARRPSAHSPIGANASADLSRGTSVYHQRAGLPGRSGGLSRHASRGADAELGDSLFHLFTDLIEADISEELARELVERARTLADGEAGDAPRLKALLAETIQAEIAIAGPIQPTPGRRRLVALVGPTGVGKTTTIAKLAANFRLREKQRVGLITVDTYRIAAVEQLRTYADIIDLPMEVVATPREMHQAVARMADLDLILMDTAGRSPRDEVKIQELKSMLGEAAPDEVHLVLSSVASAASLSKTAEQFAAVGTTALVLTKLDEAASLGNLLPLLRASRLPLSYLTHGQNVPDDIAPADAGRLARIVLGLEGLQR
jgi:flagellar biosynthesis protein FlhF